MPVDLVNGVTVAVAAPVLPSIHVTPPLPPTVTVLPVAGPAGASGSGTSGTFRIFHGTGPPVTVIGAAPGDAYVDDVTGDFFQLQ